MNLQNWRLCAPSNPQAFLVNECTPQPKQQITMRSSMILFLSLSLSNVGAQHDSHAHVANTMFAGFDHQEVAVIDISDSHATLHDHMHNRRLQTPELLEIHASREEKKGLRGESKVLTLEWPFTVPQSLDDTTGGRRNINKFNFVQDVYDTIVPVRDFNHTTTPTFKEEGTVFTFSSYTTTEDSTNLFSSGLCTRTEARMSFCDFRYSLSDSQLSGFSASGAVVDKTGTSIGGGMLGITGGTGIFFGASGEVLVTPHFGNQVSTGDFFLDADQYIVNATLVF
jgi:hypothetical protein